MDSTRQQSGDFRTPDRWNSVPVPERVAQRAYERAEVGEDGCWISTYSVASHGYAQIGWQEPGGRWVVLAHRAAWVHVNGQMPLGMTIDHVCKERRCVNPSHLRMLPNFENARRSNGADWPLGYCKNGHPNSDLVQVSIAGQRRLRCGQCIRPVYPNGRSRPADRPDVCRRGHLMGDDNAHLSVRGYWECRTCRRAAQTKYRQKNGHVVIPRGTVTHCRAGHEYTDENTRIDSRGGRSCWECRRANRKRAKVKARANSRREGTK